MFSAFENLSEDKKKKIIEICIEEFSENGYEKASTNTIVKNAGISKGILFHYFKSKKNLYLYIIDLTLEEYINKFYNINKNPSKDIFDRLYQRACIKMQMAYANPEVFKFITEAFLNTPKELSVEIQERYEKLLNEHIPQTFRDIDFSKFRKGIDTGKAIELIVFSFEGLFNKYMAVYKKQGGWNTISMESIMKESFEYMDILKKGIYSE